MRRRLRRNAPSASSRPRSPPPTPARSRRARSPGAPTEVFGSWRAETTLAAARWVSHLLQSQTGDVALIAEHERSLLDTTLDATDVARQGFQEASPLVPALQVLPLALATVWEPLDVYALLQFLSHPICPVPAYAHRPLAELVADWSGDRRSALARSIAQDRVASSRQRGGRSGGRGVLARAPTLPSGTGRPPGGACRRARRIRDFFGAGLADQDPIRSRSSAAGYAQAAAVTAALEAMIAQAETTIAPAALKALVSQCTGQGAPNFAMDAQAGRVPAVTDPGALIDPSNA